MKEQRRIAKLDHAPEWSDFLREDFPELTLPNVRLLHPPEKRPPSFIPRDTSEQNLVSLMFHKSLATPPFVEWKIRGGEESALSAMAHQLLQYCLRILSKENHAQLYSFCLRDPGIAENLLLPALMQRGLVV